MNSKQKAVSNLWLPSVLVFLTALMLAFVFVLCDGEQATRTTVRLALVWYAAAYVALLARGGFRSLRLVRWFWTLGLVCYLVHVAVAFHHYHRWSHEAAFVHTMRASGLGYGIYASYLFSLVWGVDVAVAWLLPHAYANRSRARQLAIHGFLLFMVVNGAIVFANGPTRWISVVVLLTILSLWWRRRSVEF